MRVDLPHENSGEFTGDLSRSPAGMVLSCPWMRSACPMYSQPCGLWWPRASVVCCGRSGVAPTFPSPDAGHGHAARADHCSECGLWGARPVHGLAINTSKKFRADPSDLGRFQPPFNGVEAERSAVTCSVLVATWRTHPRATSLIPRQKSVLHLKAAGIQALCGFRCTLG